MRSPFHPQHRHVVSRSWDFYVNSVAASPLLTTATRAGIYRRCGIEVYAGVRLFPGCHIHSADLLLADGAILNRGVHIENVARVEIGSRTGLGILSVIVTSTHQLGPHHTRLGKWDYHPVTIGAGCWIGARSMILPGVTIGDGCVIAAGAVVRGDCQPDGLYAGVPARRIRDLPDDPAASEDGAF